MEYGININYFTKVLGLHKAAELIAKAGFTHLDYSPPVTQENWASYMKDAMNIFDCYGLKVHQTHAPFNRYGQYNGIHNLCLDRCAEATAIMGGNISVPTSVNKQFAKIEKIKSSCNLFHQKPCFMSRNDI